MKLALVVPGPLDRRSGGYSYDVDLVASLKALGHGVEVWSLAADSRLARRELADHLGGDAEVVIFDALVHGVVLRAIERLHSSRRGLWIGLVHHLAWLEDPEPGPATEKKKEHERRFLEAMDAYVFNSQNTRQTVADLRGPGAGFRPAVICRPPLSPFMARPRVLGAGRLLFLGNLVPRKNLHGLLEALSLVERRMPDLDWTLTVAGSPDLDPRYARRCRRLAEGLGSRVLWEGRVSEEQKEALWGQTDLLALPSFHEGWGMAHAEALARGIPALAVAQGGLLELLGDAALWSEPDAPSLAATLEAYLTDPAQRSRLTERVHHRVGAGVSDRGFSALGPFLDRLTSAPQASIPVEFGDYLEAKASVDSRALHHRVRDTAFAGSPSRIVELGGGTGTMARRLRDGGLIGPQTDYLVVDQDAGLLEKATDRSGSAFLPGRFQTLHADILCLWDHSTRPAPDLVIAHALLDLFDPRAAAPALARMGARRYWLTHLFDGLTAWEPQIDPTLDRSLVEAYHGSMDDRAPGGAQGSARSGRDWLEALPKAGLTVVDVGASDWIVRPQGGTYPGTEATFLRAMLGFFRHSLKGRLEVDPAGLAWWLRVRAAQIDKGEVTLLAHQLDLVATRDPKGL